MKIEQDMRVGCLMELMGTEATLADARAMKDLLLGGPYTDTNQIPETQWLALCERAAQAATHQADLVIAP